jgi:hypothetical protein
MEPLVADVRADEDLRARVKSRMEDMQPRKHEQHASLDRFVSPKVMAICAKQVQVCTRHNVHGA